MHQSPMIADSRRLPAAAAFAALALIAQLVLPPGLRAGQIEDATFADSVEAGGQRLELVGMALLRYRIFIKAYVGALYLPPGPPPGRVLDDVPRRLVLHYRYRIEGKDFGPAAEELLGRSFGQERLAPLRARIARLHRAYRTVEPGDRYALTYLPGIGTELALNGERLALIEGADFAAAYFAIWLGEKPLSDAFRDQILAGR
jgi:hypothetical protein